MREPTLFHVKTFRYDAWFMNTDEIWFLVDNELLGIDGSHRRDTELVVSNYRPVYTECHAAWDQDSAWAPPREDLPPRAELNDQWWGWWTDDLSNVSMVPLSEAPLPVYRAFWDRCHISTRY